MRRPAPRGPTGEAGSWGSVLPHATRRAMIRGVRPRLARAFGLAGLLWTSAAWGAEPGGFTLVALGTRGGVEDGRLSAYLLNPAGSSDGVLLDAGTLVGGLQRAAARGHLPASAAETLRSGVRAVLLSHAHLDHVLGLVIASPDDTPKPIYALPRTIDTLRDHVFNNRLWANFADEGAPPRLGRYTYVRLQPGVATRLAPTAFTVEAHPLCHSGEDASTAFLLSHGAAALLYLGDTGPDVAESCTRLAALWQRIAPLVREGRLSALMVEASYPDPRPDAQLYGHLTPRRLQAELARLAEAVRPGAARGALAGLTVVVTHVKPAPNGDAAPRATVLSQLQEAERGEGLGVRYVLPDDGDRLDLPAPLAAGGAVADEGAIR